MEPGLLALLGLFVGAIVNVLVDRLPPYDYVDGVPAGARPRNLASWEYLPFASLVGARRSQRVPHRAFSVRYPLVELSTAFLFGFAWYRIEDPIWILVLTLVVIPILLALTFTDFETTFLPDKLVFPLAGLFLATSFFIPEREWWEGLAGGVVGFAIFFPLAWLGDRLNRPLMGMGDVKLSGALGLWLGLTPLLLALYLGVLLGGAVALVVYAARLFGFDRVLIPYGPYLVAGALVSWFYHESIFDWISTQV